MYFRTKTVKGTALVQLVESYRNAEGQPRQRVVAANAGKVFALFGDASYQYLGTRGMIRFDSSDAPGFATDQLYIRALERFTIGKMATGAVGGLKTAAA